MSGHALRRIIVPDDPDGWTEAGFAVEDGRIVIGSGATSISITFAPTVDGIAPPPVAWAFEGVDDGVIDGIATFAEDTRPLVGEATAISHDSVPTDEASRSHPNRTVHLDHVVVTTPALDRTITALRVNGFEPRRTRDVPKSDPPARQVFFWAGRSIVEVVGPATPTGDRPARIWGLALTTDDLEATADVLGDRLGPVTDAVQPGRRIATLRGSELGVSPAIAFMSPHA